MIKRELKLVITFYTTLDAMMMETVCQEQQMNERLIPVPASISAGCGLAWCAPPECETEIRHLMETSGIVFQDIQLCEI